MKITSQLIIILIISVVALSACQTNSNESMNDGSDEMIEGSGMMVPPGDDGIQVVDDTMVETYENINDAMNSEDCDATINEQILINAVPSSYNQFSKTGDDWVESSELPAGEGMSKLSTAARTFTQNDEYYVDILIIDECGSRSNDAKWALLTPVDDEFGSTKEITINGYPAKLSYAPIDNMYSVNVFLKDRTLIDVSGMDVSEDLVIGFAEQIDIQSIETALP